MPPKRILVLGGTADARHLAEALLAAGYHSISSLAGVTTEPRLPPGEVRVGGFGGVAGLAAYLKREAIAAVVDASHPFALRISHHAVAAARVAGIACLRCERPPWPAQADDRWIEVSGLDRAVAALPASARPFVTVGRKEIGRFFARADLKGVARMIEPPSEAVPPGWTLLLERPPFAEQAELALMREHRISHLVSKNAGGEAARAKIAAARVLRLPVIMVARPAKPAATVVASPAELLRCLAAAVSP